MKSKRAFSFLIVGVLAIASFSGCVAPKKEVARLPKEDLTRYVDPFIGTAVYARGGAMGEANCYPGAVFPFGMVQLSPDTGKHIAGYLCEDNQIEGFSHTHVSGCGCYGFGNILVTGITGKLETVEGKYKSRFSHEGEIAYPGYYAVNLADYGIEVELTASPRCGFHKYTFPASAKSYILIDVTHTLEGDEPVDAWVSIDPDEALVKGKVTVPNPFCGGKTSYTTYFAARFSKPFLSFGTWNGEKISGESREEKGDDIGAYLRYSTHPDEEILVKVGISYVSEGQALLNLDTEIPDWDFEKVKNDAKKAWNEHLNKIRVKGGTEEQKVIFYTALYHSFLMPHIFSDADGKYIGFDDQIHLAEDYTHYATFSLWDTFRAEHPLLTLLVPEIQSDMVKSLIKAYEEGGWFPKWPFANRYTNCMIADHSIPVIVDSYFKGIKDFDLEKAYEGMKKGAMEVPPPEYDYQGRIGLSYYKELGYIPAKIPGSVSRTLEDAYNDWCLAKLAESLGKEADYKVFSERATYWKNLFDPSTGFMRPRLEDGSWLVTGVPISAEYLIPFRAKRGQQGLRGEYFNNINFSGKPVLTRIDEQIEFDWGGGSPAPEINPNYFSVRWTGKLVPPITKVYNLSITTDDGFRLYLNDELLIDSWYDRSVTTDTIKLKFEANHAYNIKIEYYERGGGATAILSWNLEEQAFDPGGWQGFTEGSSWTYTWFVPHQVQGLIEMMGKEKFIEKLDSFFENLVYPAWSESLCHYWHGNEPDQQAPYLYNWAGQPWKTQEVIRRIMDELYGIGPDGIPGNDDCGQLSAWYIFSAMGFYPVCPGSTHYEIGSPIFDEVIIYLDKEYYEGKQFVIRANNVSKDNKYIQSASLDGKPFDKPWINHSDIVNGGKLIFEMGPEPNKEWGIKPECVPPSMSGYTICCDY
jgi:predicted alpha-1,2-mannosidase